MNVGVVIPAFNAERYLGQAIESVLRQTVPPTSIVVVDDGSTDRTARIAEQFAPRVLCVRQRNQGVSAARNRGARACNTPWIAFLDADDEWLPTKLEQQQVILAAGGDVCFTGLRVVFEGSSVVADAGIRGIDDDLATLLFHREPIPPGTSSTMLIRREVFERIGGYDEALSTAADWDLLIRLRMRVDFKHVPKALALYRRHPANMSRGVDVLARDSDRVLHKSFASPELPRALLKLRRRCFAWNDLVLAGSYAGVGNWGRAVTLTLRAVSHDPTLVPRAVGFPVRRLRRAFAGTPGVEAVFPPQRLTR